MTWAHDWDQYCKFNTYLTLTHEVILIPTTTGPKTNKQGRLNKQAAYSATRTLHFGRWSNKTTNKTAAGLNPSETTCNL